MKTQFKNAADISAYEKKLAERVEERLRSYGHALSDAEYSKKAWGPEGPSVENSMRTFGGLIDRTNSPMNDNDRSQFYNDLRMSDGEFYAALSLQRPAQERTALEKDVKEVKDHVTQMLNARSPMKQKFVKKEGINKKLTKIFKLAQEFDASANKAEHGLYETLKAKTRQYGKYTTPRL